MDGPSSRVQNELWAGGGKIRPGWNPLLPSSQRLESAKWDGTHHKLELLIVMDHPSPKETGLKSVTPGTDDFENPTWDPNLDCKNAHNL